LNLVAGNGHFDTIGQLRTAIELPGAMPTIDPEDLWEMGEALGYRVSIGWSNSGDEGCLDAIFVKRTAAGKFSFAETNAETLKSTTGRLGQTYANNPLLEKLARQLTPEWQHYLRGKLPDYMVPPTFIVLETLPLSPNGKVDRQALPEPVQILPEMDADFVEPTTPIEKQLAEIWTQVLGLERVGITHNFFALGGDSIRSIQVVSRARQVGLHLTTKQLFQYPTVAELAAIPTLVESGQANALVTGPVLLTPAQQWYLERGQSAFGRWRHRLCLELPPEITMVNLNASFRELCNRHEALRLRIHPTASAWQGVLIAPEVDDLIANVDLSELAALNQRSAVQAAQAQLDELDPTSGALWRAIYFNCDPGRASYLQLMVQAVIADQASWQLWLTDFGSISTALNQGQAVPPWPATLSLSQWAHDLLEMARAPEQRRELEYWLLEPEAPVPPIEAGKASRPDQDPRAAESVVSSLDADLTFALLTEASKAYRTQVIELLLTALAQSLAGWAGQSFLHIEVMEPGSQALLSDRDSSQTIGQFDSIRPVRLDLPVDRSPREAIISIKEQFRGAANHGLSFGLLRYFSEDAEVVRRLQALPSPEVLFRYQGPLEPKLPSLFPFQIAADLNGPQSMRRDVRPYLLVIEARIVAGALQLECLYDPSLYSRSAIGTLTHLLQQSLQAIVTHCLSSGPSGYTPSDFPQAKLDQDQLERLLPAHWQVEDIYPLSPLQEHMLRHYLSAPEPGIYTWQRIRTWDGLLELDVPVFERALQRLVDRYPPLRTTFIWEGLDTPLQVVHVKGNVSFAYEDWRDLSPAERDERLAAHLVADRARSFNLKEPAVIRMLMARTAQNTYQSMFTGHYMRTDGWSFETLYDELVRFYGAFIQNQDLQLPLNRPYRDYITWLQRQDQRAAESFWQETLAGFTAPTPLVKCAPGNRPGQAAGLARQHTYLSLSTTIGLQALARQQQLTLNTLIQGAWALLLSKYSQHSSVTFGVVVSGRPPTLPGNERIVGSFINALPMRIPVSTGAALVPWLKEVMGRQVEISQYEYTSQRKLREWCHLSPEQVLFESFLVYQSLWKTISRTRTAHQFYAQWECPLRLDAFPQPEMALVMCYSQRYFDHATIIRMLGHLRLVLEGMVANPEQTLGELLQVLLSLE
jgi:non-ribosomal peptide synthase protein (TIGR01720 family)